MSAFLGPIHYWLYNKIQLQEELIREIVSYGEESAWKVFSDKKLAEETVNKELRPLNELIDVIRSSSDPHFKRGRKAPSRFGGSGLQLRKGTRTGRFFRCE